MSTNEPPDGLLARVADRFTTFAERWVPDAYVFALVATAAVFIAATASGQHGLGEVVDAWGNGFWDLLPFTLQMAMVIITGYVLATTRPVYRLITRLATLPRGPRTAVAMVTVFAMASSWLNWGFSLVFSAILAKEVARRVPRVDYRALAASSLLGLGSVWAQGLSGSAALQMATPSALPPAVRAIVDHGGAVPGGVLPFSETIFLWQSFASVAIELALVPLVMAYATPTGDKAKTADDLGITLPRVETDETDEADEASAEPAGPLGPAASLERSRLVLLPVVLLGGLYLVRYFQRSGQGLSALNLNIVNFSFLLLGMALHGTPHRLMRAVKDATPAVWGVLLQFPFYAGIAAVVTKTHLSASIAGFFVALSTPTTFPALIAVYSAALGVFVPSGGSKWIIEAPYVMEAAHTLRVHLGWMVAVYDLGEALANLLQPFWMLPVLGLFGLKARDVMGYTLLVFLVLFPVVLVMVTVLGATLPYPTIATAPR
jgi:short-chain fatty acids transporter